MANELQELLKEVKDERLKARLSAAVAELRRTKKFGLVFEDHIPELLPIYSAKVRSQARVARRDGRLTETFIVQRVAKGIATIVPEAGNGESQSMPVSDLVVVKRFGEAIFPALRHVESVLHGGDAPHHTLIEADNYHALQLLEWLYAGKVDCIYIDPPYNTGARDWKYNNDYVDANDSWRHSKWLAMMQRRLKLAKRLLAPRNAVLLLTIDDSELSSLGLLLDELFPGSERQIVSITVSPRGKSRVGRLSQVDEYLFIVYVGSAAVSDSKGAGDNPEVRWRYLRRNDIESARGTKKGGPNQFYPIYVDQSTQKIVRIGAPLRPNQPLEDAPSASGSVAVFPIREDGVHMNWGLTGQSLQKALEGGYARVSPGAHDAQPFTFAYLTAPNIKKIEEGAYQVTGTRSDGSKIVVIPGGKGSRPTTAWRSTRHDAGAYGTGILRDLLPGCQFPFPKSLYAVADTLRLFVGDKPGALVLDFFAGSGTTLHALNLLNADDGGHRRCVLVTNNEASADDADRLRSKNLQPGDAEWEALGICQSVTWPRSKSAVLGRANDGKELSEDYLMGRFQEQEIRRAIRPLDFTKVETLAGKKARKALAQAIGFAMSKVTGEESFFLAENEHVAALLDPDALERFIEEGEEWAEGIETIYLPFPSGKAFDQARERLTEAWPPLTKAIEIKRPMKDGFVTNLDYFRLDFLDRSQVEAGGKLADILPALWMMAGCRGKLPRCKGNEKMLFFNDCPFGVLVEEAAIKLFLAILSERPDVDWVFIVTNDQDSFSRMCEWLPEHIPTAQRVHLWRNYVDNFLINVEHALARDAQ
jgi:adenine-specific DNA-methyltransferase